MSAKKRKPVNPGPRQDDISLGWRKTKAGIVIFICCPRTSKKWEWLESDQPGLYDFLRGLVSLWHRSAVTGRKVSDGGRKGLQIAHGSAAERLEKWNKYKTFINSEKSKNKKLTTTDCRKLAADHFKVSLKTITRHTK